MNKVMDPQKVAGTMRDFAMARYEEEYRVPQKACMSFQ